jgi:hypothetical protein
VFCVQYLILSGHLLFLWKPLCEASIRFKGPAFILCCIFFVLTSTPGRISQRDAVGIHNARSKSFEQNFVIHANFNTL